MRNIALNNGNVIPPNGALSGMIITAATAAVLILLTLFSETVATRLNVPLTTDLKTLLLISIVLMFIHKAESYWAGEYDQCPVYLTSGRAKWAQNPRQCIFVAFVGTFLGMLALVYLAILGPPWHLVIYGIWLAHGLHELHHLAKSLNRGWAYPGIVTSLAFSGTLFFGIYPRCYDLVFGERSVVFYFYYLLIPFVFTAFYFEDRKWFALATAQRADSFAPENSVG